MLKQFDKNVTSQMKTLAFILMLVHHMWKESVLSYFEPVAYEHILLSIGLMGKICVGIFMFLSGYGMMSSAIRGGNMSVVKRLKKLRDCKYLTGITNNAYEFGACDALNDTIKIIKAGGNIELSKHSESQDNRTGKQKTTLEAESKAE